MVRVFQILFVVFIIAFFSQKCIAQNKTKKKGEIWNEAAIELDLKKKWTLKFSEQYRLSSNPMEFDKLLSELEIERDLDSEFNIGFGTRLIQQYAEFNTTRTFDQLLRWHLQFGYSFDFKGIDFKFRWRFQKRNYLGFGKEEGDYPRKHTRYKITAAYKKEFWKVKPQFSAELFRRSQIGTIDGFSDYRLSFEIQYKINKNHRFELAFLNERTLEIWEPTRTHILALKYRFRLKV